ncbi:MAG TPA: hypothetical protein VF167_17555 [Longimicrobiaceae bacterium]
MNHRDVWFVGLLALAYLYLDAASLAPRREALARGRAFLPPPEEAPEPSGFALSETCPRDLTHPVKLRPADGAKWCLVCDEGFYPALS